VTEPVRLALDNGAVLLLREDHGNPSIAIRGSVRAGAAYGAPGVAEFAARLVFRGTTRRSASAISDAIESLGAALSSTNAEEAVAIHGRCTRETLKATLNLLTESLATPAFAEGELEKVRGEVLGDFRAQQDDTRRAAVRRLAELLYSRGHAYGRDPKGDEKSVRNVKPKTLRAFHEAHYGAAGMILAFSGDIDAESLRNTVAPAIEGLNPGSPPKPVPAPRPEKEAAGTGEPPRPGLRSGGGGRSTGGRRRHRGRGDKPQPPPPARRCGPPRHRFRRRPHEGGEAKAR